MEWKINVELSKVLWNLTLPSLEKEETPKYLLPDSENKRSSLDSHALLVPGGVSPRKTH